jgi:hypothetical protein
MSKISHIDRKPTDEQAEKNRAILERWTLVSDESGHNYVIPLHLKIEFDDWNESDTEEDDFDPDKYEQYRIEGGLLTFVDPKVN